MFKWLKKFSHFQSLFYLLYESNYDGNECHLEALHLNERQWVRCFIAAIVIPGAVTWFVPRNQPHSSETDIIKSEKNLNIGAEEFNQIEIDLGSEPNIKADHKPNNLDRSKPAVAQNTISLLSEPDHGSPDYLDARDLAVEKIPREQIRILRHRIAKVSFKTIDGLLTAVLDSNGESIGPYDLSLFDDFPCTFTGASAKQRANNSWELEVDCREYYGPNLTIRIWHENSRFATTFGGRKQRVMLTGLSDDDAGIYEFDPTSLPRTSD